MCKAAERAGLVTPELLRQLLDYNPDTGAFTRKGRLSRCGRVFASTGEPGGIRSKGYRFIGVAGRLFAAHRLAWFWVHGEWPKHLIDHINGDKLDNRIANLRDVPQAVNNQNVRSAFATNVSRLLGVKQRGTRYYASISVGNKTKHLGAFDTAQAAHAAYVEAKRLHHEGCTL